MLLIGGYRNCVYMLDNILYNKGHKSRLGSHFGLVCVDGCGVQEKIKSEGTK